MSVDTADSPFTFRREMGLSHQEFFRNLPKAMGDLAYSVCESTVMARSGSRTLRITLAPEQERRIALLRLPVTWVSFAFEGYTEREVNDFIGGFERSYQRGGG